MDHLATESETPPLPWKSEHSLDDLADETENKNKIFNLTSTSFNLHAKELKNESCIYTQEDADDKYCIAHDPEMNCDIDACQDILKELVPVYRDDSNSENVDKKQVFNYSDSIKPETIKSEINFEEESHHLQKVYLKSPISTLEDTVNETGIDKSADNNVKELDEGLSGTVHPNCLGDNTQECKESHLHSTNIFNEWGSNSGTPDVSPSLILNNKERNNRHVTPLQSKNSSNTDVVCKCYKCRWTSYRKIKGDSKCDNCGKTYKDKWSLTRHKKTKCNFLKTFRCYICQRAGFSSSEYLKNHNSEPHIRQTENHQSDDSKRCVAGHLLSHKLDPRSKKSSNSSDPPVICEFCQKTFRTRQHMMRHCKLVHNPVKKYICTHCKKQFSCKLYLKNHIESLHLPDFICEICHSSYKTRFGLSKHIKTKHTIDKKYVCETCGKEFVSKSRLKNHLLVHSNEKPWICDICGKRFRNLANLQQHKVTHSDKRPFACALCDSAFRIRNHLKQHMAVHGMVNTSTKRKRK